MTEPFGIAEIETDTGPGLAVWTPRGLRPLSSLTADGRGLGTPPTSLRSMLADWDSWCSEIAGSLAADDGAGFSNEDDFEFRCPVSDPPSVYCAGANYRDHIAEMGPPNPEEGTDAPFHFLLPPAALTGHRKPVPRPDGCAQLDWEIELVAVIGTTASCVAESDALDHVAGYTIANDISMRDRELIVHPWFGVRWLNAKGQIGMQPVGPAVVPARFVADPMDLELELSVNGEVKQRSNTSQMIFSIAEQIAYLSQIAPLLPGDLILTGTPAGTGSGAGHYLADGDEVSATIEGLGTLANEITPARRELLVDHAAGSKRGEA